MSYQQGPPPPPPPPSVSPPEYWTQHHKFTNIQPNPPVLSFRAFHATHFSWPQRQAFFGGGAPENYYHHHHHPWLDSHSSPISPIATDTLANASEPTWDHLQDLARHHHLQQQHTANKDNEITAIADKDDVPGTSMFGLTQEAIEIFEFSRRFREEKRAALAEERARMARRRSKRRRLTRRGFAPDEGNSGSDDDTADLSDAADKHKNNNFNKKKGVPDDDSDNGSSSGSGSEDEGRGGGGSEEEEDDEFVVQTEPPATDVAFLTQPSRQRDRTRQKLYGLKKASDTIKDKETTSSTTSDEMWSMQMLEAMLNQTFIESLGGPETTATATTASHSNRRRSRDSSGKGGRRSQQQSQIVYWPGMPMRC